jgi:hypothetical protein
VNGEEGAVVSHRGLRVEVEEYREHLTEARHRPSRWCW